MVIERLFTYPAVLRRHCSGPLAAERDAYLEALRVRGAAHGTLLWVARYCLCVAHEVQRWPPEQRFSKEELDTIAASWATRRVAGGRASAVFWPQQRFRSVAAELLRTAGRLLPEAVPRPGRFDAQIDEFITALSQERALSAATCQGRRWQVQRFALHLDRQGLELASISASDVDVYFQHAAQRWSRVSLRSAASALRAWFRYGQSKGWVRPGLADAILVPRVYQHEGLPLGPTWEEVGQMVAVAEGDQPSALRDRAILLLLAVYGLRSGEVRRLCLEDIDWSRERIRIVRSKSSRREALPLAPAVGNAIARYLRQGRPRSEGRTLFLTVLAPFRPLSAGGLYDIVRRHLSRVATVKKGWGPHGLRHACARHLVEAGLSLKEVGDHLGHRSPEATRIYAKVNLTSLRQVALEDLGGLV